MIRVICHSCGATLNAKDELAGQTRPCPKCGRPVPISRLDAAATPGEENTDLAPAVPPGSESLRPTLEVPERMNRESHWLVCDKSRVVACWQNNGKGWMLNTRTGPISAKRNQDQIPAEGDFRLVELKLATVDEGHRLVGITSYRLARRWALTKLARGEDEILSAITDPGSLGKEQKVAVRDAIRERFMPQIWENSREVLDYLADTDYHSPGV